MVTNFRQERLVREKRQKIYGALFLFILIVFLGRGPIFNFFGRIGHFMGIPFWQVDESLQSSDEYLTEYTKPKSALVEEVLQLKKQNTELKNKEAIISVLEQENSDIKKLFGRDENNKRILTRVLSRPPFQIYDTLIIDIGSINGVREGNLVYTEENYAIGKVSRVYDRTSVVTLFSSPKETYSVMVKSKLGEESTSSTKSLNNEITFIGIGNGGFEAQVPKHMEIENNTKMVLSSINPSIIGIITGESVPETGSMKQVYGSLPISIKSIDWVSVDLQNNSI